MAIRGQRPKPGLLKMISGNPGHRPIHHDPAFHASADYNNGLKPPCKLKSRQAHLWETYIRRAPWLTAFDVPRAYMWIQLHTEFEKNPSDMVAGRIAQLRALGSELGLDPSSRARIGIGGGEPSPSDKYFT